MSLIYSESGNDLQHRRISSRLPGSHMNMQLFQHPCRPMPVLPALGLAGIWFSFSLYGILHHELWLDELHHWQLSILSRSVWTLPEIMKHEGHPVLWNLLLFVTGRFTPDPFYMQLLHILLSTAAAFVFLRYAPFSWPVKAGFQLSYFLLYEFTVVSRSYVSGVLLAWILCALLSGKNKKWLMIAICCGLLAQVHLFFLFISLPVFFMACSQARAQNRRALVKTMCMIYLPFLIFSCYCIIPPGTDFFIPSGPASFFSAERAGRAVTVMIKSFLHVPDMGMENCWNSNYFLHHFKNQFILPAILYWFIPLLVFYRRPHSLFLFYFSSLAIAGFLFFSPLATGIRYYGVIFIAFIMALWIRENNGGIPEVEIATDIRFEKFRKTITGIFFLLLFSTQWLSGCLIYYSDVHRPFSQASATVSFISHYPHANRPVAVSNTAAISVISGLLGKPVYSPESHAWQSFSDWRVRPFEFSARELLKDLKARMPERPGPWLLVSNHPVWFGDIRSAQPFSYREDSFRIRLMKAFRGSMISTENYFVYEVSSRP